MRVLAIGRVIATLTYYVLTFVDAPSGAIHNYGLCRGDVWYPLKVRRECEKLQARPEQGSR